MRRTDEDLDKFGGPLQSFGHVARLVLRAFSRSLEPRIIGHGVSIGQWGFLRELWREDGITQRELSERVSMREPSTVAAVRALESAGLVRRQRDAEDRRKIRIHVTPRGHSLRKPLLRPAQEVNTIATKSISKKDLETTRRVMVQLMERDHRLANRR